jgi:hypothetical protein
MCALSINLLHSFDQLNMHTEILLPDLRPSFPGGCGLEENVLPLPFDDDNLPSLVAIFSIQTAIGSFADRNDIPSRILI